MLIDVEEKLINIFKEKYKIENFEKKELRGALCFYTGKEDIIAKKVKATDEKLLFVNEVKKRLLEKGYENIDYYYETEDSELIHRINDEKWVFTRLIRKDESDFEDNEQIYRICRELARLHQYLRDCYERTPSVKGCQAMPTIFDKRIKELQRQYKKALKGRADFDMLFTGSANYFLEMGKQAIKRLNKLNFMDFYETELKEGALAHCDLTYQNILVDEEQVYFTNFELLAPELRVYDLVNIIRRKMRKCDWDIGIARKMLESYDSVGQLKEIEHELIRIMLIFPQKYWRVVNKYYNMNRSWGTRVMLERLQEAVAEKESHYKFISEF